MSPQEFWTGRHTKVFLRRYRSEDSRKAFAVDRATGCWIWSGCSIDSGYGVLRDGSRQLVAHRYYYEQSKGPIEPGLQLHHTCGHRRCVNPSHLIPLTAAEHSRLHRAQNGSSSSSDHKHDREALAKLRGLLAA